MARHCVRLWSHFSRAHIPSHIHARYTHKPPGGESECSSLWLVGTSGLQETYRYLQCLLTAATFNSEVSTAILQTHTCRQPLLKHPDNTGLYVNCVTFVDTHSKVTLESCEGKPKRLRYNYYYLLPLNCDLTKCIGQTFLK